MLSLARAGFHALGLQTFLTAGPRETRACEIPVDRRDDAWPSAQRSLVAGLTTGRVGE
jgi:ribosome-binding ATPase YchF (GTP1/OBG family)